MNAEPIKKAHSIHPPCTAFVCERMPWELEYTIRIVLPGLDNGSAVWLETDIKRDTQAEAESMLDAIMAALPAVKRETPNDQAQAQPPRATHERKRRQPMNQEPPNVEGGAAVDLKRMVSLLRASANALETLSAGYREMGWTLTAERLADEACEHTRSANMWEQQANDRTERPGQ